ncbi:MAG: radical SAM protein [Candidatus Omnitrophica bacterium]|nr:radical SAM protein [Candidatus Omnitrophota bacterium]
MQNKKYKYIYGPVPSWRLGSSLGIDPVSKGRKICSFDCVYCQIGKTGFFTNERRKFIETREIIDELESLPPMKIDYLTFSGAGEPTLAENLGEMVKAIRQIRREHIAVITNSSLLDNKGVREDLVLTDFVIAKLDAPTQAVFKKINQPMPDISFERVIDGIKTFRQMFKKKLALQIMFIEQNRKYAQEIAQIAKEINPDEVQINTPLRPCDVKPLSRQEIDRIEGYFNGLKTISVYRAETKKIKPISDEDTLKRRGKIKS